MNAFQVYTEWLKNPLIDEDTKAELGNLQNDDLEIEDRFFRWLEFGTGGLRGRVGAGSNRINVYTVRLVTQALANKLKDWGKERGGVVIAYDSRHMSLEFTRAAAGVLVGNGIPVYIFPDLAPTPLLSYAVRFYQASAGIVITASHNPPEYNGYKVYNEHGNQMLSEEALSISNQMAELGLDNVKLDQHAEDNPLWHWLDEEIIHSYYQSLLEIAPPLANSDSVGVLYSPLHGTGARYVPEILKKAGFQNVFTVSEQMVPDGNFPTVNLPNPEDPAAFRLAFEYALRVPCDLIITTDPDADRMGIAVYHRDEWVLLNGNQAGVLFSDFLLAQLSPEQAAKAVVIKTIVTTEMVQSITKKYGANLRETLTGFKYIGALMDLLPQEGKNFLFGFEESYGYLAGTAIRDKDAVLASLLAAQMAVFYKKSGLTLIDRLNELFLEHGYYSQDLVSYSFATSREAEKSRQFITKLRTTPISEIGQEKVVKVLDFEAGTELDVITQITTGIDLPREGVLQWVTDKGSKVTLRPSGTEAKMKLYLEASASSKQEAEKRIKNLADAFDLMVRAGLAEQGD